MQPACPVCHVALTIDLEAPALELENENVQIRQGILGRLDLDKWRSSSKIEALIEELSNLRKQDATTKSIVFSQFVNFLDLIAYRLQKAGFTVRAIKHDLARCHKLTLEQICRLEGTMSPQARDATIKYFSTPWVASQLRIYRLMICNSEQRSCHCIPRQLEGWRCCLELDGGFTRLSHGQLVEPGRRVP